MQVLDVNILVYAHRAEGPEHPAIAAYLDELVNGDQRFGVPEIVFSSLVRIATQPKLNPRGTPAQALDFCRSVMSSPRCLVIQPSESHWTTFDRVCRAVQARGKLVADAYLAAFALDRDDEWVTTDRDFANFPGLRWRLLPGGQSFTNPR